MSRQPRTLDTLALAVSHLRGKGPSPHLANEVAGDVLPVIRELHAAAEQLHADPRDLEAHVRVRRALAAFDAGVLPAISSHTGEPA